MEALMKTKMITLEDVLAQERLLVEGRPAPGWWSPLAILVGDLPDTPDGQLTAANFVAVFEAWCVTHALEQTRGKLERTRLGLRSGRVTPQSAATLLAWQAAPACRHPDLETLAMLFAFEAN
jgi:hypothetical protein